MIRKQEFPYHVISINHSSDEKTFSKGFVSLFYYIRLTWLSTLTMRKTVYGEKRAIYTMRQTTAIPNMRPCSLIMRIMVNLTEDIDLQTTTKIARRICHPEPRLRRILLVVLFDPSFLRMTGKDCYLLKNVGTGRFRV